MRFKQRSRPFRDATRFVIAVEGEKDEAWYFEGLATSGLVDSSRVQLLVLPAAEGKSAPEAVLSRLEDLRAERRLLADDEVWMVVDLDDWPAKTLKQVHQRCKDRGWNFVLSNPCFEVWLQLHFAERATGSNPQRCKAAWRSLRQGHGQSKKWPFDATHVDDAIRRSTAADGGEAWPEAEQSHVHRLVAALKSPR